MVKIELFTNNSELKLCPLMNLKNKSLFILRILFKSSDWEYIILFPSSILQILLNPFICASFQNVCDLFAIWTDLCTFHAFFHVEMHWHKLTWLVHSFKILYHRYRFKETTFKKGVIMIENHYGFIVVFLLCLLQCDIKKRSMSRQNAARHNQKMFR